MKIIFVGDSMGLPREGCEYEDTYFYKFQKEYKEIDCISFFKRAMTSDGLYELYESYIRHYNPDIVISHSGLTDCAPRLINDRKYFWRGLIYVSKRLGRLNLFWLIIKKIFERNDPKRAYISVNEYGIINVFMSTVGIVQVLLTLNTEVAISRYYYDAKNEQDFKEFCSTSIKISSGVWLLMSLIMVMLNPWLAEELSFSKVLTLCMIPVATYSIINSIFIQIYQPLLRSKKVAIVSSVQSYLAFCLSVIFMLCMETERYYGYIWGTIAAMILLATYLTRQIRPFYVKSKINREHVKYLLSYSLPYIPYTLSGIILAQFGRIFMSTHGGFDAAGLYSFVSNVGALMMILISVGHSAWNPYYLQYMTNKDYKSIDKDYDLIWRVTLISAMGLTMFGNEIALIMARPEFLSGMYLLPILIIGYVFYQWSYVYLRSTGFAKRTIWNAVAILISGISNILLNHLLIDRFYILGVAISFCISYFILYAVAYLINKYILKTYVPQSIRFIKPFLLLLLLMAVYQYVFGGEMNLWIKIPVFFILTCLFMWGYKSYIFKVLRFYH